MRKPERFKEIDGIIYKRCTKCCEFKILETEFTKAKNTVDKRTPNCKECRRKIPQNKEKSKAAYKRDGYKKKAEYYQKNKDKIHKQRRDSINSNKERLLMERIRKKIRKERLNWKDYKNNRTKDIIGCSKIELFNYLKNKFNETYGIEYSDIYFNDLHIDHIIPISSANSLEELIALSHYTNLQFLHKDHNMAKKTNLDYIIPPFPIENYKTE